MSNRALLRVAIGLLISLGMHLALGVGLAGVASFPEVDFELELPDQLELGMTDAIDAAETSPSIETPSSAEGEGQRGSGDAGTASDSGLADAGRDAGGHDASLRDAGEDAAELIAAGEADAGASRIPAGAQIAIRIDLDEIRASSLEPQVRELLDAIPDWHFLLDGSGIDTVSDLDRILIASPNLRRAQMILAGRHAHEDGPAFVRAVVDRYNTARGTDPSWRQALGVPVARWPNPDVTERVIAIVGPAHFVVCREEDLERVLAIAQARAASDEAFDATGPDALLSMGPEEALSLEVEGARQFARGRTAHVPRALRLAVLRSEGEVDIRGAADFDDSGEAETARAYWESRRQSASRGFMGFTIYGRVLGEASLDTPQGPRVPFGVQLDEARAASLLEGITGFIEGAVRARERSERGRVRQHQGSP